MKYNAFISYSHHQDSKLAPSLEKGLEQFAKPTFKRRALHVFRDSNDLSASSDLKAKIEEGLRESEYFIFLASTKSSESVWCKKEVMYWKESKPIDNFLIVLTEGELVWDEEASDFDWTKTTAIPKELSGCFKNEPLFVDFRDQRSPENLTLENQQFKEKVVLLAATLHGKSVGDLIGEDLRQHKKTLRIRNSAIAILTTLLIGATTLAFYALDQKQQAEEEKRIAQGNYLISESKSVVNSDPTLALRLCEEAMKNNPAAKIIDAANKLYAENSFYSVLFRHSSAILSVAFSPNGDNILTGSEDATARLWDLNGILIQEFEGHSEGISSVAFSPNGLNILTGSKDGTARTWDLEGVTIKNIEGHSDEISSVAFSPNGLNILTGSKDRTARLWDLNGNTIQVFEGQFAEITSVAFSPEGEIVLSGANDGSVRIWNLDGKLIRHLKGFESHISSLAFSPDSNTFLAGTWDQSTALIDLDEVADNSLGQYYFGNKFMELSGKVTSVAFSPDGKSYLTGASGRPIYEGQTSGCCDTNTVRLWILKDRGAEQFQEFKGHTGGVTSIAYSPDGKSILTGSRDTTARLWILRNINSGLYEKSNPEQVPLDLDAFLKSGGVSSLTPEQKNEYDIE